ncbi:hypothetical protein LEP1GSC185_3623 [Leptospira licerasiae serovar Varillal str. VAR 010]|uniref:Uncharacterized protein n=1 Tax=Leptospira licerasiae str. MMD4847 TaxID=1049971 RepID=A0ABN0HDP6_9LEPT|nr:hypothetical protein LEP1GSC185_3623 [Leptospira licerasiae serovar Varillal str. VAR 010]EJZ43904.1 hypothetical protein LEP1GSC178_2272 [Leptospira licerasiae str. MMD4847]
MSTRFPLEFQQPQIQSCRNSNRVIESILDFKIRILVFFFFESK